LVSFSYELTRDFYQFTFSDNFLRFREASLLKSCSFKTHVFRDVTPCRWPNGSRRFERQHGFIFKGHSAYLSWRRDISSKRRQLVTYQHGVTSNVELIQVEFIAPSWRLIITRITSTVSIITITFFIAKGHYTHCTSGFPAVCSHMCSVGRQARCISRYCCYSQLVERG
jgi:hypothetical protein